MEQNLSTSNFNWRESAYAVCLCLLLIAIVEPLLARHAIQYNDGETLQYYLHQNALSKVADSNKGLVVLGDSTMRSSLDPQVLESQSGLTAVNLAFTDSSGFMSDYISLQQYLAVNQPPRAIILGHSLRTWEFDFHKELYDLHFTSPTETLELMRGGILGLEDAADSLIQGSLSSYRYKAYLMPTLVPALKRDWDYYRRAKLTNKTFKQQRQTLGYFPDMESFSVSAEEMQQYTQLLNRTPFKISPANEFYFDRLRQLAKEHDIVIYFVHSPLYRPYVEACHDGKFMTGMIDYLTAREDEHFQILSKELIPIDEINLGHIVNHTNAKGALLYSTTVATELKKKLK